MICNSIFYNDLYRQRMEKFLGEKSKKESAPYGGNLFVLDKDGTKETAKKHGKQSLLDDAGAAGKDSAGTLPKTETESRIIVKPDGTKILLITTRCGQSVRVKSLKLSDPTDMENEGKNQRVAQEELEEKMEKVKNGSAAMVSGEEGTGEDMSAEAGQMAFALIQE